MGALRQLWLMILAVAVAVVATVTGDGGNPRATACSRSSRGVSLASYCESWRASECVALVGKYMTSPHYESDLQRATAEAALFLANKFVADGDEKDAWIFDVDDTLLSTLPYFQRHHFGAVLWCGGELDCPSRSSLERWLKGGEAPALEPVLDLYLNVKDKGLKIFLISSRAEAMREATVDNLVHAGYTGWAELILRCNDESYSDVRAYKTAQRRKLVEELGYRLWGIVGVEWSSFAGYPGANRTFQLPNPMYYESWDCSERG